MQHPRISKLKKIKYFFKLILNMSIFVIIGVDEQLLNRIIISLTLNGLSLNQIREFLRNCIGLDISKHSINLVQNEGARRAERINKGLDKEVAPKISIIEVDETFQGRGGIILGAVAKKTDYILSLKSAGDRSKESLGEFIKGVKKRYYNIRVVITDLYPAYKNVVKELGGKVKHLFCHVHAKRLVMEKVRKLKKNYHDLAYRLKRDQNLLTRLRQVINDKYTSIRQLKTRIKGANNTLNSLNLAKKMSKSGRTKTITRKINSITNKLQRWSARLVALNKELPGLRKRRNALVKKVRKQKKRLPEELVKLQQSGRLAREFYILLDDKSRDFKRHLENYLQILDRSPYPIAPALKKMINNNPQLFSLKKKKDLESNYQNTNGIEHIFGLLRPSLNSTRLLKTRRGTDNLCELFKLYHNTTAAYTGINNRISPI